MRPTSSHAASPRRSLVFFNALDEDCAIAPLGADAASRAPTGGFRRWRAESHASTSSRRRTPGDVDDDARALAAKGVTQREWTELKEGAARERLKERT